MRPSAPHVESAAAQGEQRRSLRTPAPIARALRREFWPAWVFYLPLVPYLFWLSIRHGHPLVFTCCNPGIGAGGGVVGESKHEILSSLDPAGRWVLPAALVPDGATAEERTRHALELLRTRPELGGLPAVLKPDAGQRGFAVRVARTEADVAAYMRTMTAPAVVQAYHPGPHECGVLWVRRSARGGRPSPDGRAGFVFAVTHKEFPFVTGDGVRTLERLILDHPRYRLQARVFLARFAGQRTRVPAAGERVRLAEAGNHCQGTLFRDGSHLLSPELEAWIDGLARSFRDGLDFGRFDIRYECVESLRRGERVGVVELNGTLAEATNLYDPDRSIVWAYRVLFAQWRLLYELGAERMKEGKRPLGVRELWRLARGHYRTRAGSAVAD